MADITLDELRAKYPPASKAAAACLLSTCSPASAHATGTTLRVAAPGISDIDLGGAA